MKKYKENDTWYYTDRYQWARKPLFEFDVIIQSNKELAIDDTKLTKIMCNIANAVAEKEIIGSSILIKFGDDNGR